MPAHPRQSMGKLMEAAGASRVMSIAIPMARDVDPHDWTLASGRAAERPKALSADGGVDQCARLQWLRTTLIPHASPPASLPVQAYAQHLLLSAPVILEVRIGDVGRQ